MQEMYQLIIKQIFVKNYIHERELNHENNKTHETLTKKNPQGPITRC